MCWFQGYPSDVSTLPIVVSNISKSYMLHTFSFWAYAQLHLSRYPMLVSEGTKEWIQMAA